MDEFASDPIRAVAVLVEGNALFGLVVWILDGLGDQLVLSMSKLALVTVRTGLVSAPLTTHFRFIFALVNLSSLLALFSGIKPAHVYRFHLRRGLDHKVTAFNTVAAVVVP